MHAIFRANIYIEKSFIHPKHFSKIVVFSRVLIFSKTLWHLSMGRVQLRQGCRAILQYLGGFEK